jgi:hypothetical protein
MTNKEITTISVGEPFELFKEERFRFMPDGGYLEALDDNDGFMFTLYLTGIEYREVEILDNEIIRARMVKDGNKILFLVRFGDSPLIFEASFDPTLYRDRRAMQIAFDNHMLTFVVVDRTDNIVRSLRMANFPMKLKQALITAWTQAYEEEDFSHKYTEFLDYLYRRYSTLELWDVAEPTGFFGEGGLI